MKKTTLFIVIVSFLMPHVASAFSGFNDPGFTFNSQDSDKQWGLPAAGFIESYDIERGKSDIVVAVIDTGVDATHEDLRDAHFVSGYDFVKNKPINGKIDSDDNGHGTLMAGIIAATVNNKVGIAGAAPEVSIMPLKALGSDANGTSDLVAQALNYAADNHADIINLSLGGHGKVSDPVLDKAVEKAYRSGAVIVGAAGNDYQTTGTNLDDMPVYPICSDNGENMVLGVTALDKNLVKPDFANYGKRCIDIAAPGKRILSTINHDPITKAYKANSYAYVSGTSIAAAFVTSLAALIKSKYSYATNIQIREQILKTARKVDGQNVNGCSGTCAGSIGAGIIDADEALTLPIVKLEFTNGDLIQDADTGKIYISAYGRKRPVSDFVLQNRYLGVAPKIIPHADVQNLSTGTSMEPKDGSMLKFEGGGTVYMVKNGLLKPITGQVFKLYKLSYTDIQIVPADTGTDWVKNGALPPPDGTILRIQKNRIVYLVTDGVIRPMSKSYFYNHGLQHLPQVTMTSKDIKLFPFGNLLE